MDNEVKQNIAVLVLGENPISRQGAYSVISQQQDIYIVGQAASTGDALSLTRDITPKTVVIHTVPPKGSFEMVYRLKEVSPEVSVIVMVEYDNDDEIFQAIMAGASTILTKKSSEKQFTGAIRSAFNGERQLSKIVLNRPMVALRILKRFQDLLLTVPGFEPLVAPLSSREKELLKLIADGSSTEAIARSLKASEQVLEGYVTSILHKLNINERTRSAVMRLSCVERKT
jgi:DNA-binding NarL/FixJ family response regulator